MFPKILPVPTGPVQIKCSAAKTIKVQFGGKMTYFKLTGDFRLQRKLQILSLDTRSPIACLSSQGNSRWRPSSATTPNSLSSEWILSTYYVPQIVLGTVDTVMNKTEEDSILEEAPIRSYQMALFHLKRKPRGEMTRSESSCARVLMAIPKASCLNFFR